MNLHEYPRPPFDTGIGIHWCAGIGHVSTADLRSFWLPQLEELGISWVKVADQRRALPLVEELLAAGIMPIVQVRRPAVNPGHLAGEQLREVEALIDIGVRYFEFNSRPDAPSTWLREELPPNAPALIAEHIAIDLEAILTRGGLPAIPAISPGSKWDLVRALIELGRKDLLAAPIWQAIHNFGSNRPLNYPHDPGNRDGAPLTQEYYMALAQEGWNADAWQGHDLETINRLRWQLAGEAKPADISLPPDRLCWLDYERLDARNQILLGRSLPILSTSGGWIVGKADDPRYPAVTPLLHLAQTLEACRVMMGTSRRYSPAPDYYFCTAFWLLANEALESDRPVLEEEAWYSHLWPQQTLPIVPALKAEPKRTRLPQWNQTETTNDGWQTADGGPQTPPLRMAEDRRPLDIAADSVIAGHVRGGAGASLWLVRSDGVLYRTVARTDGTYQFVDLSRGRYTLWVDQPPGSRREHIELDGHNKVEIRLTVDRWGYEVTPLSDTDATTLRCRVESSAVTAESGTLAIRLRRSDDTREHGSRVMPMARRADGTTGCEFPTLASGEYRVEVLGVTTASGDPHPLEALIDLSGPTLLTFVFNRPYERGYLQLSQIYGQVTSGWGRQIMLVDGEGKRRYEEIDGEDRYQFEMLPPGLYTLAIVGREQSEARNRLALDGRNQLQINFTIYDELDSSGGAEDWGAVEIQIPNPVDEFFTLISISGEFYTESVEQEDRVRFEQIPPGAYTLSSSSGYWQPGLEVYPNRQLTLTLPAQAPPWDWQIYADPTEEGQEGILVQVLGRQDLPIYLSDSEGNEQCAYTGSVEGDPFSAWFAPLQPGQYLLIPHDMDIQAPIELPRLTTFTVIFRRSGGLSGASQLHYTPL
ncbi:MAG: hypothetical protein KF893_07270 [Caldilineaceae bacterium]|nr:hypothetical protein [Caldilineaceae bacterium]